MYNDFTWLFGDSVVRLSINQLWSHGGSSDGLEGVILGCHSWSESMKTGPYVALPKIMDNCISY